MDEIISEVRILGEDGQPIKPLIEKVMYTFDEFQALYEPFCGYAHVAPAVRIAANQQIVARALCVLSDRISYVPPCAGQCQDGRKFCSKRGCGRR